MSESGSNRRQKAAAAREAANAGEKRRERTVRIVGAVTVIVVVAAIIGLAVYAKNSSSSSAELVTATADPNAPSPKGALPAGDAHAYGIPYGAAAAGAPVLAIWEDFQCPACGKVEQANGAGISKLAEDGTVALIWRPTTFLDGNLNNDSSVRAVAAWGCAIDAGKVREYHDVVYENQPTKEGTGYTRDQLVSFAGDAGITGPAATTFEQCVDAGTYLSWAANSTKAFYDANIQGTPYATLNGTELGIDVLADPAKLEAAVAAAPKQ